MYVGKIGGVYSSMFVVDSNGSESTKSSTAVDDRLRKATAGQPRLTGRWLTSTAGVLRQAGLCQAGQRLGFLKPVDVNSMGVDASAVDHAGCGSRKGVAGLP
jgi:hypothetical protein